MAARRPPALIADLAWTAGSWVGTGMGVRETETYSASLGVNITGHLLMTNEEGGVAFTEIVDSVPVGCSLAYRVRHFNPDMTGWEDKAGKPVVYPLVAVEKDRWWFDGMTLLRTGRDALTMWVGIHGKVGVTEVPLHLTRVRLRAR